MRRACAPKAGLAAWHLYAAKGVHETSSNRNLYAAYGPLTEFRRTLMRASWVFRKLFNEKTVIGSNRSGRWPTADPMPSCGVQV